MRFLLTALLLGTVSMMIVFFSGMFSGLVRLSTLMIRTVWAFCMTSAASFFLLMLFDLYEEMRLKKLKKAAEEISKNETLVENPELQTNSTEGFQPMNTSSLPNVEK